MNHAELYGIVLLCNCTTAIANAFRRALGLPQKLAEDKSVYVPIERYSDTEWCIANFGSPMDGRHG